MSTIILVSGGCFGVLVVDLSQFFNGGMKWPKIHIDVFVGRHSKQLKD
jgi:hypothetical protein